MTKKKMTDWTDHLGSSGMPDDELNFQTGNNFGLDGFQQDVPDNQGPETIGRATSRGILGLPDGTIPMERDAEISFVDLTNDSADGLGMDFTAMLSDDEGNFDHMASLEDLEWLDPTQAPDLNRLPNNEKTLNSIPSLEEAWGKGKSSNGINLVPNRDKEAAQYEVSLGTDTRTHKTADEVKFAIQRALRRAHYGEPIRAIQEELVATLGHDADRTVSAMKVIKDEHGLIGHVFVRASAFPGIKNGKWVDQIKAKVGSARYVITDDQAVANKLSMKMVSEVPWDKALAYYAPRMKATGYRFASDGLAPKEALRRAFRLGPAADTANDSPKPVEAYRVATDEEVQEALQAPRPVAPVILTADDHAIANKRKAALVQMAHWVKGNKLSRHDAMKICASGADACDMLRAATTIMTASAGTPIYDGLGARLPKEAQMLRRQAFDSLAVKTAAIDEAMMKKAQARLAQMVKVGTLTIREAKRIATMSHSASDLAANTAAAVQAAGSMRKVQPPTVKTTGYKGPIQKAALQYKVGDATHLDPYMERVVHAATESGIKTGEILGYLKWARQKMAEGEMGDDLTVFLKARFALPLRKAARELLKEIRSNHEGLSGHLYVDAEAYVSKTGTTGCEEGALKHRTNGIKHVLAMSRCAGCVFANANGVCTQYNKKLVATPPTANAKAYQAEAIRLANANDSEVMASMFNPNEFNLRNEPLDDLHVAGGNTPENLGEVLFGGVEV